MEMTTKQTGVVVVIGGMQGGSSINEARMVRWASLRVPVSISDAFGKRNGVVSFLKETQLSRRGEQL